MSDISTVDEAIACREAGADCVSTTLCGYTPYTMKETKHGPSLEILRNCVKALPDCPVLPKGVITPPVEAARGIENGAWAVVVGSAITRPHLITQWFSEALQHANIV